MFGPWATNLDDAERRRRLTGMRALALAYTGNSAFAEALRRAEDDADALVDAHVEFDLLQPLIRRRLLATYAKLSTPR